MATTNKSLVRKVTETKKATTEDLILGNEPITETKIIKTYEDESVRYKITNLQVKNKPITVTGDLVETFIGSGNKAARKSLKEGALKVITKDSSNRDMYQIEVISE